MLGTLQGMPWLTTQLPKQHASLQLLPQARITEQSSLYVAGTVSDSFMRQHGLGEFRAHLMGLNHALLAHDSIAGFELTKEGPGSHPQRFGLLGQELAWHCAQLADVACSQWLLLLLLLLYIMKILQLSQLKVVCKRATKWCDANTIVL